MKTYLHYLNILLIMFLNSFLLAVATATVLQVGEDGGADIDIGQ